MTTREAIAIVRDEAKYHGQTVREALLIVATIAEHHADSFEGDLVIQHQGESR